MLRGSVRCTHVPYCFHPGSHSTLASALCKEFIAQYRYKLDTVFIDAYKKMQQRASQALSLASISMSAMALSSCALLLMWYVTVATQHHTDLLVQPYADTRANTEPLMCVSAEQSQPRLRLCWEKRISECQLPTAVSDLTGVKGPRKVPAHGDCMRSFPAPSRSTCCSIRAWSRAAPALKCYDSTAIRWMGTVRACLVHAMLQIYAQG